MVTDLLMNETISDLALAKVGISYSTSLLHCILHSIGLSWSVVDAIGMQWLDAGQAGG